MDVAQHTAGDCLQDREKVAFFRFGCHWSILLRPTSGLWHGTTLGPTGRNGSSMAAFVLVSRRDRGQDEARRPAERWC